MTNLVNSSDNSKGFPQTGTQLAAKNSADVWIIGGGHQGPEGEAGNAQQIAVGAASVASAAVVGTLVDITSDVACFVQLALAPVAVVDNDYFVPANTTYRFPITTGNKVAVIQVSAAGKLYISPVK